MTEPSIILARVKTAAARRVFYCRKRPKMVAIVVVLALFLLTNLLAGLLSNARRPVVTSERFANGFQRSGSGSSSSADDDRLRYGEPTKRISIDVLSSKDRVKISVDDATVIDDSGLSTGRGMHIVVLNQYTGMVMAQRVFDTYMDDEPLVEFLQSVSTGRIMIFAIKDEASFHLTNRGRRAIQMHIGSTSGSITRSGSAAGGSFWLPEISWRDMWAMVAKHQNVDNSTSDGKPGVVGGLVYGESYSHNQGLLMQYNSKSSSSLWGPDVMLRVQVPLNANHNHNNERCESWITASDNSNNGGGNADDSNSDFDHKIIVESELMRRQRFCSRIEGYGNVCSCVQPAPLDFHPLPIPNSNIEQVPVVIVAGSRADYLYRTLKSVLNSRGVQRHMVTVHVDGYYDEPLEVARLLGVRAVPHMPAIGESVNEGGVLGTGRLNSGSSSTFRRRRVTQHYKAALTNTFSVLFPQAEYAIILEDDLDVSVDFFSFFSQTLPLLEASDDSTYDIRRDSESLYCVSAWNDQGYVHTASRLDVLLRVDWMPGLGWMLKRSLFKDQLESEWPTVEKPWDWDMWMRTSRVQRGRQCVVPEVSRTYHFGSSRAVNVNPFFQRTYFERHAFYNSSINNGINTGLSGGTGGENDNKGGLIRFKNINKMTQKAYLNWMEHRITKEAHLLDHSKWPCRKKQWNSEGAKNRDNRFSDNSWLHYVKDRKYRRSDEEFFIIDEMINNDETMKFKKLFVLYIKMDDPYDINKDAALIAWTPLAKCLSIWDLDTRGHYKGMWRLYLSNENRDYQDNGTNSEEGIPVAIESGTELFIIGCPFSYFCKFKPANITAIWYSSGVGEDDDGEDDFL